MIATTLRRPAAPAAVLFVLGLAGCAGPGDSTAGAMASPRSVGTVATRPVLSGGDSVPTVLVPPASRLRREPRPARAPRLSPGEDSVATHLVFAPANQAWFLAAPRANRLLLDLGRVDVEVRKDTLRLAAYKEAVAVLSPVRPGARVRLFGPWGSEDATVSGFDTWNGRIVATVEGSPRLDSLARVASKAPKGKKKGLPPLVAAAVRADSARGPLPGLCERDSLPRALAARADSVRDSLALQLTANSMPVVDRLVSTAKLASSRVAGCFGPAGRALVVVSLRAGGGEFVRERVVALNDSGRVTPLRVVDYRFTAHDALAAFDADGDGVDDLAAKGSRRGAGGTVVLKLVDGRRLERLASGFVWEAN